MTTKDMDINFAHEEKLFNGKNFHVFIYQKTESAAGLHQHDHYEFTLVLTGRYYQEINGKRVLLERGDFSFIPIGSHHQSFYEFGPTRILNVGISKSFFEEHYQQWLPSYIVGSQIYHVKEAFLAYIESAISSLHFMQSEFTEFIETLTFYVVNRIRHFREVDQEDTVPEWLKKTIEAMHEKVMFADNALVNMIKKSGKSQEYLTRAMQTHYGQTPMQMINDIRINFAKKQLELTNYSIADIAQDVGYSSPSLFIKNFKKLTSCTPNQYRKNLRKFTPIGMYSSPIAEPLVLLL